MTLSAKQGQRKCIEKIIPICFYTIPCEAGC